MSGNVVCSSTSTTDRYTTCNRLFEVSQEGIAPNEKPIFKEHCYKNQKPYLFQNQRRERTRQRNRFINCCLTGCVPVWLFISLRRVPTSLLHGRAQKCACINRAKSALNRHMSTNNRRVFSSFRVFCVTVGLFPFCAMCDCSLLCNDKFCFLLVRLFFFFLHFRIKGILRLHTVMFRSALLLMLKLGNVIHVT